MPENYPQGGKYVQSIVDRSRGPDETDPDLWQLHENLREFDERTVGAPVGAQSIEQFESLLREKLQQKITASGTSP